MTQEEFKQFIKEFNEAIPSKEFFESCKKAGKLFKADKLFKEGDNNEQDMDDIRSSFLP